MFLNKSYFLLARLSPLFVLPALVLTAGCAKELGTESKALPDKTDATANEEASKKLSVPLLTAGEVAQKLAQPPAPAEAEAPRTTEARVQLAKSLEAHGRSVEVISAVRDGIARFDSLEDTRKVALVTLGADVLPLGDSESFANIVAESLRTSRDIVQIAALAAISRHPALGHLQVIENALSTLLANVSESSVLVRHWFATAINARFRATRQAGAPRPSVDDPLFALSLRNPDLELDTLLRGVSSAQLKDMLGSQREKLSAERRARLQQRILDGGAQ